MTFTCYNFSIPGPRKWINFALFVENSVIIIANMIANSNGKHPRILPKPNAGT